MWQENLAELGLPVTDGFPDDRDSTGIPVFVQQTFEDALPRVALFAVNAAVVLQNLMNDRQERLQLGRTGLSQPISRRLRVGQYFL
ncbi:hypothetical protein [Gimesia sp.]|uniref:hypothetical protein n=1 Tax=Gimesia sp. TaxID=2024833 RepID=UPI0032ED7057